MAILLVVEDDELIRDMLSRRLQREGYEVITAVNGVEAILRARSEHPDVIVMDIGLPLLNGLQATERLKAAPDTWNIPIVALTAFTMTSDRAKCLAAGCDAMKPSRSRLSDCSARSRRSWTRPQETNVFEDELGS